MIIARQFAFDIHGTIVQQSCHPGWCPRGRVAKLALHLYKLRIFRWLLIPINIFYPSLLFHLPRLSDSSIYLSIPVCTRKASASQKPPSKPGNQPPGNSFSSTALLYGSPSSVEYKSNADVGQGRARQLEEAGPSSPRVHHAGIVDGTIDT